MLNRKDRIHPVTNKTVFMFIQMLIYAAKELSTPFLCEVGVQVDTALGLMAVEVFLVPPRLMPHQRLPFVLK